MTWRLVEERSLHLKWRLFQFDRWEIVKGRVLTHRCRAPAPGGRVWWADLHGWGTRRRWSRCRCRPWWRGGREVCAIDQRLAILFAALFAVTTTPESSNRQDTDLSHPLIFMKRFPSTTFAHIRIHLFIFPSLKKLSLRLAFVFWGQVKSRRICQITNVYINRLFINYSVLDVKLVNSLKWSRWSEISERRTTEWMFSVMKTVRNRKNVWITNLQIFWFQSMYFSSDLK